MPSKKFKEEQQNFRFVNAIYFDGCKDATQMVVQGPNDKHYGSVPLEEHYTAVGEPESYYLTHIFPEDGKGRTIAQILFDSICDTELEDRPAIVGTDVTACMTGKYNGCIRHLEKLCACSMLTSFLYDMFFQPLMVPKVVRILLWIV